MSAAAAVAAAMAAGLRAELPGVDVVVGAVPAAGVRPQIEVGEAGAGDWSAVRVEGRELRTAVTVRVAAGQRGRLAALVAAAERVGTALAGEIDGWRVGGAVLLRSRQVREKGGDPAVLVEHRVRVAREN